MSTLLLSIHPCLPSGRIPLYFNFILQWGVCDAVAVCPYLFRTRDINFRSFPRPFPHAMCVRWWVRFHTFWVTICQGRVRVAWPISFLFTDITAHFQSKHPHKQKKKNHNWFDGLFFSMLTLFKYIPDSHPGYPRTTLKYSYMSCGGQEK